MPDYSLGTARGKVVIDYDGSGVAKAQRGMGELQASAGKTGAELSKFSAGQDKANKASQNFATRLQGSRGALTAVSKATLGTSAVIVAGLGLAANKAIDFEKQISAIGAVSGATGVEMEDLRKKALKLGADTTFSASDAANAMEELAKAGVPIKAILGGAADATVSLAAAGGVALPKAAEIASNAMNQFNIPAAKLPKVADLIAGAANASAISVEDFGHSLSQSGAVANLAGVTFDDLSVAIAEMGNAGIKGSDAGTSLKTMLSNLQPQTRAQTNLFRELGLITKDGSNQFYDATGNLKGMSDVAGILQNALKGMSAQQKQAALQTLFGSDAIRAAAIIAKGGKAGFDALAGSMSKVTAAAVAAKRMDNVSGSIEQLKGSAETAAIQMGTLLLPALKAVADFVTNLVNKFSGLDPKWQKLIVFGGLAGAALLAFVGIVTGVVAAIAAMAAAIGGAGIAAAVAGIAAVVALLGGAFAAAYAKSAAFRSAINSAFQSLQKLGKAIQGAVMPVLQALYGVLKDRVAAGMKIMQGILQRLQPAFKAIGDFVQQRVVPALQQLGAALVKAMPLVSFLAKLVQGILGPAFKVLATILGFLVPILLKIIGPIFSALIAVISAVIGSLGSLGPLLQAIGGFLLSLGKVILTALIAPFVLLYRVFVAAFSPMMPLLSAIGSLFVSVFGLIKSVVTAAFAVIMAIVGAGMSFIESIVSAGLAVLRAIWGAVWGAIGGPVSAAWAFIRGIVAAGISYIGGAISAGLHNAQAVFSAVWGAIKAVVSAAWGAISSFVSSGVKRVVSVIGGIVAIVGKVRGFFNQLKTAASGGIGSLVSFVGGIPGRIIGALGNLGGLLFSAGADIIRGLLNGLSSLAGAVADKARSIAASAASAAKAALGIHSPSKVFIKIGQYVGAGLVKGLTGTLSQIRTTANKMASLLYDAVDAKLISSRTRGSLQKTLNADQTALTKALSARTKVVAKLKAASASLASLQKASVDLQGSIAQQITDQGKVVLDGEAFVTPSGIIKRVSDALAQAKAFQANIATLIKRGVSADVIKQIAQAGPDAGGAVAKSLAKDATDAQIKQLNSMSSQLAKSAGSVGKSVADNLYSAGIRAAQGLVKGLQNQQKAIEAQMLKIANSMKNAIKKTLKIKSPSRVFYDIGNFITKGLSNGILASASKSVTAVKNLSKDLAGAVVNPAGVSSAPLTPGRRPGDPGTGGAGAAMTINAPVTVNAPQNMDPRQVADYTARRVGFVVGTRVPFKTA